MKMIERRKIIILLTALALLSMTILAASLQQLMLAPGQPIPLGQLFPPLESSGTSGGNYDWMVTAVRYLFMVIWLILPVYVVYLIISPEARKQFLKDVLRLLPIAVFLYFILSQFMNQAPKGDQQLPEGNPPPMSEQLGESDANEPPVFNEEPPEWMVTATTITLGVTAAALAAFGLSMFLKARALSLNELQPLNQLAMDAQQAIDAIEAGGDLRDVILRCYYQMANTLAETRSFRRGQDMTAREFEQYLLQHGIPGEPVHHLTSLFEQVRYGGYNPGRQDERTAISSLNAIIAVLRRKS